MATAVRTVDGNVKVNVAVMGMDVSAWRAGKLEAGWRLTTWWMFCGCEFGCFGERRGERKRVRGRWWIPRTLHPPTCVIRSGVSAHSTKPVHVNGDVILGLPCDSPRNCAFRVTHFDQSRIQLSCMYSYHIPFIKPPLFK